MTVLDFEAWIDSGSAATGVPVAADWRPRVARFLALAAEMAAVIEAVPLEEAELELAPVFRLPEPE